MLYEPAMADDAMKTLLHPFETGMLAPPQKPARVLFLGARAGFRLPPDWSAPVHAVQGFRPDFLALRQAGVEVTPLAEGAGHAAALVLAGRHRAENELRIAEALRRVASGGTVVVAGGKTDGIASLRRRVEAILPVAGSAAKHHGLVFWLERPADAEAEAATATLTPRPAPVEGRYVTGPGMFSADAVDPASRLLADSLPDDLAGRIADFCAGWGYLAARLAERPSIRAIDLYEAGYEALEAARENLADAVAAGLPVGFHWQDLAAEPVAERYDAIVMNPPFHQGRAAEPELGARMIAAARTALKPGGRLFVVANRQLPYERALSQGSGAQGFRAQGETVRDARYKVLWAVR